MYTNCLHINLNLYINYIDENELKKQLGKL